MQQDRSARKLLGMFARLADKLKKKKRMLICFFLCKGDMEFNASPVARGCYGILASPKTFIFSLCNPNLQSAAQFTLADCYLSFCIRSSKADITSRTIVSGPIPRALAWSARDEAADEAHLALNG